ncbi:MAG: hypothetical protein A3H57_01725 [Candidatus Taylorbacteria bacterium RIFCSPLOWO2_02_FULL_43_11]|uniref:ABC transporter substrate-binding protein n=1 Tax=Candidatus Taylorbacteria bacterium RIFCSPHIGHO2_02_FULL_43_32b TaxID=1802306 RepID=A0A1G2ME76_9BACT|nr:MAG: hypothetical protein A2743_00085 [Candidatus Taylorbacteria bacterium RIFCSPHIGHO2_01_FULL_43_47]OHA22215.1 MAG: hypothetical protein A3C72_04025 [Candidatus Taylorbacteria bacterium RIFCSPHIGHO2_02_FULL_43_32b]OHA29050.1 MAG: hypothetical protein A3B08_00190 [Candidatus Taylorbacteria bacterium RIFCSPLOWO2_01_FULL_43_44]OHA35708.1 MAG: hypothetical protein A3H57_01725 [Candidatus Taylorbacteria bacterium RIFCSPLOWO2_02_FULL_43_11]
MKSTPFQIVVIALFALFIVIGMVVLYFSKGDSSSRTNAVTISLWGTVSPRLIAGVLNTVKPEDKGIKVNYVQHTPESFEQNLIEALASSKGPDAIIISQDSILRFQSKIYPIPYKSLSERTFIDTYIYEAELFLSPWGVIGVPFSIDPLVMYWNRDLFGNAGIAAPPKYWDEFYRLAEQLTVKDDQRKIETSAVALGEFSNINNAKAILSALAAQGGVAFTKRDDSSGRVGSSVQTTKLTNVLDFYTEFANPVKAVYSWSRGMPNSQSAFARGDVAVYFDMASQIGNIVDKNPNLDFDVTYFPNPRTTKTKITYGDVLAVSALRSSPNISKAMQVAMLMGSEKGVNAWSTLSGLPPVRRDLLAKKPGTATGAIFYDSVFWANGWLDPDARSTKVMFRDMVENITSGWMTSSQAAGKFNTQLNSLISGK